MEYNLTLLRSLAENVLYATYTDDWLSKYVDVVRTINTGEAIFNITHTINPGSLFDPNDYNDRMVRLNLELGYMYQVILRQENNINNMVIRLDSSIDKALNTYHNIQTQSNILRSYIEATKDYLEVFDAMNFISDDEITFTYKYDSIYFPELEVERIGSNIKLYESEEYNPSSDNIFDYYNLVMYSDRDTSNINIYANISFLGRVKLSVLEFDLVSYNDLTIMSVEKKLETGDYQDITGYTVVDRGYHKVIVFDSYIEASELRVKIENHNPVHSSGKKILIDNEIRRRLMGYGDIETPIREYMSRGKLDQAIGILKGFMESNQEITLDGWIYTFVIGNITGSFFGNLDLIRETVTVNTVSNVIGHAMVYDITSLGNHYVISNAILSNKRFIIPDYTTLSFDNDFGLNYTIRMYVESNVNRELKIDFTPPPFKYDGVHSDISTISIYRVSDMSSSSPSPIKTILYDDFVARTIIVTDDDLGNPISEYAGEPFVVIYKSRGRYNLFKELGYPHIYISDILNVDVNKIVLKITSGSSDHGITHISSDYSVLDSGLKIDQDDNITYDRPTSIVLAPGDWTTGGELTINITAHGLSDADPISFYNEDAGSLPIEITEGQTYYAYPTGASFPADQFKVCTDATDLLGSKISVINPPSGDTRMDHINTMEVTSINQSPKNYICVKETIELTGSGSLNTEYSTTYAYTPGTLYVEYEDIFLYVNEWSELTDWTQLNPTVDQRSFTFKGTKPDNLITDMYDSIAEGGKLTVYYKPLEWTSVGDNTKLFYNIVDHYNKETTVKLDGTSHTLTLPGLITDYYILNSDDWISDGNLFVNLVHPSLEYYPFRLYDSSNNEILISNYTIDRGTVTFETSIELSGEYKFSYYYIPVKYDIENIIISESYVNFNGMLYLTDYQ